MISFSAFVEGNYFREYLRENHSLVLSFADDSWFVNSCMANSRSHKLRERKIQIASLEDHIVFSLLYGFPRGFRPFEVVEKNPDLNMSRIRRLKDFGRENVFRKT